MLLVSAGDDLAVGARPVIVVDRVVPGGQVVPELEVAWSPAVVDRVVG